MPNPNTRRPHWQGFAIAVVAAFCGFALRLTLTPILGRELPYITLYPFVMLSGWWGGFWPAIVCTATSAALVVYTVLPPEGSFRLLRAADVLGLALYVAVCFVLAWLFEVAQRARALAEQRLRDFEAQQDWGSVTLASIADAVVATDAAAEVTLLNRQAAELIGRRPGECRGKPVAGLLRIEREHSREPVENPIHRVLREGTTATPAEKKVLVRDDGAAIPIDYSAAPIRDRQGHITGAVLVFRNLAERRHVERQLETVLAGIEEGVAVLDGEWRFTYANSQMALLARKPHEELMGKVLFELFPELGQRSRESLAEVRREGRHTRTQDYFETYDLWYEMDAYPLGDEVCVFVRDINARKRAEDEILRQAQELARSNAELQQFAYVASHDLQEPLRNIATFTQLLERRAGAKVDDECRHYMRFIVEGAHRMGQLIQGLLSYSRLVNDDQRRQTVRLNDAAQSAIGNLERLVAENRAVIQVAGLPVVEGNAVQLVQLFQNLFSNAIKYRSAVQPAIAVDAVRAESEWVVSVSDNGVGVPESYRENIFGLFKRLHGPENPGTGIGLAICRRVVERHGGRIWVESNAGGGAIFRFTLPARD